MSQITKYLKRYSTMIRSHIEETPESAHFICGDNARYVCIEEFVLEHGQQFRLKPLPKSIKRGTRGECYENIWKLVDHRSDLTYVEGIGFNPRDSIGFTHAWAVDRKGNVIDPTWDYHPQTEYFGIPLDWEFVNWTMATRCYFGLLENHRPEICAGKWEFHRASAFPKPVKHAALRMAVAS